MFRVFSVRRIAAALAVSSLGFAAPAAALNLFSPQQDVEIGRRAAADAERQLPIVRDPVAEGYVNAVVQRLAAAAPGPRFAYRARIVDSPEINAFALPGGFVYVNRGLLRAVRSEDELAGVLAHEISHVAQRHGTSQASKAYGAQLGVGLLGQLLGGRDNRLGAVQQMVGSLGLNALFLKFSRNAESEADRVGAATMARAGYEPLAMASFFDLLAAQQRSNPGAVSRFFSDHPAPGNRAAAIRAEAARLSAGRRAPVGGLQAVQARLGGPTPGASARTARLGTYRSRRGF
jgi:beta-barrel assembly-enhancing protease